MYDDPDSTLISGRLGKLSPLPPKQPSKSAHATHTGGNQTRRFSSEEALREHLPWHWKIGESYHCISQGDIDSLTYLRVAIEQRVLDYCLVSTWCMAPEDAKEIGAWVERGLIKRVDFYVGEIFENGYRGAYEIVRGIAKSCGGRVGVFRNHSKVMLGIAGEWQFAIASSANVNTNPRCENTVITLDKAVVKMYKDFFDGISPFNKGFESWMAYEVM